MFYQKRFVEIIPNWRFKAGTLASELHSLRPLQFALISDRFLSTQQPLTTLIPQQSNKCSCQLKICVPHCIPKKIVCNILISANKDISSPLFLGRYPTKKSENPGFVSSINSIFSKDYNVTPRWINSVGVGYCNYESYPQNSDKLWQKYDWNLYQSYFLKPVVTTPGSTVDDVPIKNHYSMNHREIKHM